MESQINSPNKSSQNILIFVMVLLLLAGVFLFLFLNNNKEKKTNETNNNQINVSLAPTIVKKKKGGLVLKLTDGLTKKTLGQSFIVDVILNAPNGQITSYDLVLNFDKKLVELIQTTPAMAGFSFVPIDQVDGVVITAFKTPGSKFMNNTDEVKLLTLTFQTKAKGSATISIIKEKEKKTTKFVDNQSKVYYPEVNQLEMEIN